MNGGILVLVEHLTGEITEISFEMLGAGRTIANALQAPLWAFVFGKGAAAMAPQLGAADTVLVLEGAAMEMPSTEAFRWTGNGRSRPEAARAR